MIETRLEKKVKAIVVSVLAIDESEYSVDKNFYEGYGLDSLDFVELVMETEKVFDMSIPDDEVDGLKTPRQLIEYLIDQGKS